MIKTNYPQNCHKMIFNRGTMKVTEIKKAVNDPRFILCLCTCTHTHVCVAHTHTHFVLPMHHISSHQQHACPNRLWSPSTALLNQTLELCILTAPPDYISQSSKWHPIAFTKLLDAVALQPIFLRGKAPTTAISRESFEQHSVSATH